MEVWIMENKSYDKFISFMAEMVEKYGEDIISEEQKENSGVEVQ
jgi:hypothetical protein